MIDFVTMCKGRAYGFMEGRYLQAIQPYLSKWQQYCRERNIDVFEPGITNGIEFIVSC